MSDRQVREPARALSQRFDATESKVRNLGLRAYRGAVRTARSEGASPGIYNELISVLELVVPSGRWLVNGAATFYVANPSGVTDLYLKVAAFDPSTDEPFAGGDYDMPPARYYAAHTSTAVIITLRCMGDIIHLPDDNVKVSLQAMNAAEDAYSLIDCRLTLNPV